MQTPYIVWKEVENFAAQFKIDGVSIIVDEASKKFAHAFANAALMSFAGNTFVEEQNKMATIASILKNAQLVAQQDAVNIPGTKKLVI